MPRRPLLLLLAGGLATLPAIPVAATEPLITDIAGDATPAAVCVAGPVDTCGPRPGSQDAIDIVSGDIATSGNRLTVTMRYVDLATPDGRTYNVEATAGDVTVHFAMDRVYVWVRNGATASASASVVFDAGAETITWSTTLTDLDALRASVCATCARIERGTVLSGIVADSSTGPLWGDTATASRPYVIG